MSEQYISLRNRIFTFLLVGITSASYESVIASDAHVALTPCARFSSEAPEAWRRLEASLATVKGVAKSTFVSEVTSREEEGFGKIVTINKAVEFWIQPNATKVVINEYNEIGKRTGRIVYCSNPEYSFILEQENQSDDYILKKCGYGDDLRNDIQFSMELNAIRLLKSSLGIESDLRTLPEILGASSTKVVSCRVPNQAANHVEIQLRFLPVGLAAEQDNSVREATIRLDPAAGWRVISSATRRAKEQSTFRVDYPLTEGPHIAQISRSERTSVYPEARIKEVVSYGDVNYSSTPIEEFYLTYYGLPECSRFVTPSMGGIRLAIIGLALLAIGTVTRVMIKRRNAF